MKEKEKYTSGWYEDRQFVVMEVPDAEDMDYIQKLMQCKGIHYDCRVNRANGRNVLVVFKDNITENKE